MAMRPRPPPVGAPRFCLASGLAGVYGSGEAKVAMALFSFRKPPDKHAPREAADRLYAACVTASRRPALYLAYGIPDTLQGRFEALALHLFPVLYRLMHAPGDDPDLARLVSESFVADMDSAFREMGVGDVTVPKRMHKLYRSFGGRITAYKAALAQGGPALADAIARNVFPDGATPGRAEALAQAVRASVEAIRDAPLADLRDGAPPFPAPAADTAAATP